MASQIQNINCQILLFLTKNIGNFYPKSKLTHLLQMKFLSEKNTHNSKNFWKFIITHKMYCAFKSFPSSIGIIAKYSTSEKLPKTERLVKGNNSKRINCLGFSLSRLLCQLVNWTEKYPNIKEKKITKTIRLQK